MTKLTVEDRIRRRREELGLSRRELAELTGLPISRIWANEHTGDNISDEDRAQIVDALNDRVATIAKLPPIVIK